MRAQGDKITFANVGLGSASHLCGLMFMSAIGTKLTPVYYKGGGPALNDAIAGHIDVYCDPATGPTPYIQSGTIAGYAITSKKRVPSLPNLPTAAEAGLPAFDVTTWYALYAPRNTPKPIVDALVDALQKALRDPALVSRFAELSMTPVEEERATPEALEGCSNRKSKGGAELSGMPGSLRNKASELAAGVKRRPFPAYQFA